jgi:hypothetical protein
VKGSAKWNFDLKQKVIGPSMLPEKKELRILKI